MLSKKYHFVGIGGIGMGTLASLILAKGQRVSGSDIQESAMVALLREKGASIFIGHDEKNVHDPDFVIYSSAISQDNPELESAKNKNIPILRRAELLAQLMDDHIGITVAGAHGKTTTTSMISCLLIQAGLKPTTAVGGIISGGASYNATLGEGRYFISEVDESDGSFLNFRPFYSVITNVDFEHVDYYHTWENILGAYQDFIAKTQPGGCVFVCGDDIRLKKLVSESGRNYLTYGFLADNDIVASEIRQDDHFPPRKYSTEFQCFVRGRKLGEVGLFVPGKHNVLNALATIGMALQLNIDFSIVRESLANYRGVNRRFQCKGEVDGIVVIDDYGHHPTEIAATLQAAQKVKRGRLITVFQPHRYTRTQHLMKEFAESLLANDILIVTDIYAASEPAIEGVSSKELCDRIVKHGKKDVVYLSKEKIVEYLTQIAKPDDLILTLGAGDVTKIGDQLIAALNVKKADPVRH
ncbi:MAG: UDP-N-acetylmuramate--L-alanine ligase [Candidatus Omnitrophica bacterium]|nr:UDP-N-acetylmuramate--L-alanine ligase [Candidatus Omnitrophota bacterium]